MHKKNGWRAGLAGLVLWCATTVAHAQYLGLYLSPPGEQNTTRANAIVEPFEGNAGQLGTNGQLAMGNYTTRNQSAKRASADQFGGAGGRGNYLAVSGDTVTITMTGQQKYLGFWWSAGDATNQITFYDDANNLLASFSTQTLMTFLDQQAAPSWVTAIDGNQYPKAAYYGNPNAPLGRNSTEPYAYMNLILEGTNLLFGKVEITGDNFELDNFAVVREVDVSTTWVDLNRLPLAPTAPGIGVGPNTIYTPYNTSIEATQNTQALKNHSRPNPPSSYYQIEQTPQHGVLALTNASLGEYIYTPRTGFVGKDQFTYQLCEPDNDCLSAVVTVLVAPQAADDHYVTPKNTPLSRSLVGNDHIAPDSTYTLVDPQQSSQVQLHPDGRFTFTLSPDWRGTFTFAYRVCLPAPDATVCDTAQATIDVVEPAAPALDGTPLITQPPEVGTSVSGSYQYKVTDGTPEGNSLLEWRIGRSNNPNNARPVARTPSYTPQNGEQGQYLFLCVTPVNSLNAPGSVVCSSGQAIRHWQASSSPIPGNVHAVPGLSAWVQGLLAALLLGLGALRMRRL